MWFIESSSSNQTIFLNYIEHLKIGIFVELSSQNGCQPATTGETEQLDLGFSDVTC